MPLVRDRVHLSRGGSRKLDPAKVGLACGDRRAVYAHRPRVRLSSGVWSGRFPDLGITSKSQPEGHFGLRTSPFAAGSFPLRMGTPGGENGRAGVPSAVSPRTGRPFPLLGPYEGPEFRAVTYVTAAATPAYTLGEPWVRGLPPESSNIPPTLGRWHPGGTGAACSSSRSAAADLLGSQVSPRALHARSRSADGVDLHLVAV